MFLKSLNSHFIFCNNQVGESNCNTIFFVSCFSALDVIHFRFPGERKTHSAYLWFDLLHCQFLQCKEILHKLSGSSESLTLQPDLIPNFYDSNNSAGCMCVGWCVCVCVWVSQFAVACFWSLIRIRTCEMKLSCLATRRLPTLEENLRQNAPTQTGRESVARRPSEKIARCKQETCWVLWDVQRAAVKMSALPHVYLTNVRRSDFSQKFPRKILNEFEVVTMENNWVFRLKIFTHTHTPSRNVCES